MNVLNILRAPLESGLLMISHAHTALGVTGLTGDTRDWGINFLVWIEVPLKLNGILRKWCGQRKAISGESSCPSHSNLLCIIPRRKLIPIPSIACWLSIILGGRRNIYGCLGGIPFSCDIVCFIFPNSIFLLGKQEETVCPLFICLRDNLSSCLSSGSLFWSHTVVSKKTAFEICFHHRG